MVGDAEIGFEHGAVFLEANGWERPQWYASNAKLLEEFGDQINHREAEWDSRWWSPIINAEHLAMRDRAGMVDLTAFAIFDVTGPSALDVVQSLAVAQLDVAGNLVRDGQVTPDGFAVNTSYSVNSPLTSVVPDGGAAWRNTTGPRLAVAARAIAPMSSA